MTMTDLIATLTAIRERTEQATEGPWENDGGGDIGQHWSRPEPWEPIVSKEVTCGSYCMGGSAAGVVEPADVEFIAHARADVPRLLAAVEAVMELHKRVRKDYGDGDIEITCDGCLNAYEEPSAWPCPTVQTITDKLTGDDDE